MLSLNPWDILWTIVNLLVLYAIFRKFLFQPVMNIIHEREDMINKQFEDAQKQQDDAAQMKSEYENQLKGAREKADQIILDAKTRAQEEYNNKMEATRVEADVNDLMFLSTVFAAFTRVSTVSSLPFIPSSTV